MTTFIRLLESEDKAVALAQAIEGERAGRTGAGVFKVSPESFAQVPGSPFAYWVSEEVRRLFKELPPFECNGRTIKQGLATADDCRFVRAWWEVPTAEIGQQWFPFGKGGAYSLFYADVHLLVNWENAGVEILNFVDPSTGKTYSRPRNIEYYFRPGLTWPLRTQSGLALRIMPGGCIFGHKGPAVFAQENNAEVLLALLAVASSQAFCRLVELQMAFGSYEVGVIQRTPVPVLSHRHRDALADLARRAWSLKRSLDTGEPTSHAFTLPALLQMPGTSLVDRASAWSVRARETETRLVEVQKEIDSLCFDLYGFAPEDRAAALGLQGCVQITEEDNEEEAETEIVGSDVQTLAVDLLGWLVGVAFGQFDARLATGELKPPREPEPFEPLPICSPGMLTDQHGLPAKGSPEDYPILWPEDGILVDDPGLGGVMEDRDIGRRIRQVVGVVWNEKATDIEQELCKLLGVSELRDFLRKPSLFFDTHLKRYSKSRRKAPIYWLLSTTSGSYTLWIYYQRLTEDTLFKAVTEYVTPKIGDIEARIAQLEVDQARAEGRTAAKHGKELAELTEFRDELKEFREELLRVARLPYKPNLNDGVQITAAPLWKLFRLAKWRSTLEETWKTLERGDYDWAHLALAIWPDRAKEKCRTDRSLAIAHDLESLYQEDLATPTRKPRRRKAKG